MISISVKKWVIFTDFLMAKTSHLKNRIKNIFQNVLKQVLLTDFNFVTYEKNKILLKTIQLSLYVGQTYDLSTVTVFKKIKISTYKFSHLIKK